MKNLIPALIKAKRNFAPITKSKYNPFFKSKYADLDGILAAVEPALGEQGLAIVQLTDIRDGQPVLLTQLRHESGEYLEGCYYLPKSEEPQKLGGALTFARRYAISAMLCITADDDIDGNEPSNTSQRTAKRTSRAAEVPSADVSSTNRQTRQSQAVNRATGEISQAEWMQRKRQSQKG